MEMRPRLPSRYRHQGAQRSTSQNAAERTSIYLVEIRSSVPRRRPVPVRNRAARQVTGGRAGDAPPVCAAAPQRQHRRPSHPSPPDPQAPESHGRATCHWPSGRRRLSVGTVPGALLCGRRGHAAGGPFSWGGALGPFGLARAGGVVTTAGTWLSHAARTWPASSGFRSTGAPPARAEQSPPAVSDDDPGLGLAGPRGDF